MGTSFDRLDRFGRVIEQKWTNGAGTTTRDRYLYVYDRAGNRTSRENTVATAKDEYYEYDGLHRLVKANRGALSSGTISDAAASFNQAWPQLESTGNWRQFRWDADGGGDSWTTQDRDHNEANELTAITGTGANWVDPEHDPAGNMTRMPKPDSPTDGFTAVYDAWNRMVELKEGTTTVATYRYDGQNRRIRKVGGNDTFEFYHNSGWQVLEVRLNGSTRNGTGT